MNPIEELKDFIAQNTISKASKLLGVSRQTIYSWVNGKHSFTLKNWLKLQSAIKSNKAS
jgi:predicted transcriptional regulator